MSEVLSCLSVEQEALLRDKVRQLFDEANEGTPQSLFKSGFMYPTSSPSVSESLPDEWDELMDRGGITSLSDVKLEEYLEKWLRLIGYAYWVQGVWQDRVNVLERLEQYVKDYVFAHAPGGREQKAAVAGAHPITEEVMTQHMLWKRKLDTLNGLIRKWEKIEFAISRAITNRQGKPSR